ncbi:hypothetical protein IQ07DRAFT_567976 [Pyrenochaeta sp. DS3sAY3a]|nr:hypothetical protein IQ07DRAFT_567976 [Pyrenochaeta sp. DS3sAY3a]
MVHSNSGPTPVKSEWKPSSVQDDDDETFDEEYLDVLDLSEPLLGRSHGLLSERRQSINSQTESPGTSRSSSPRPSIPSLITTPSLYTINSFIAADAQRPSVLTRLRSSISTKSAPSRLSPRPTVLPSDFQRCPQEPEKHFVDSIGMIHPGVCDRSQCKHPIAHFVSMFRLCEPIEYTTALADHGITYTDYDLLLNALSNFLEEVSKGRKSDVGLVVSESEEAFSELVGQVSTPPSASPSASPCGSPKEATFDTTPPLRTMKQQAAALNKLLEDITWNLQAKGIPVMICVSSFSLFAPQRISETHIQILHVSQDKIAPATTSPVSPIELTPIDSHDADPLSFIDPFSFPEFGKIPPRPTLERKQRSSSSVPTTRRKGSRSQHLPVRDRSIPSPLWPNAIPSRRRSIMNANAERYGMDPYFRAWMRAKINARTQSNTYAKYMIEQEDDPLVNKRLDYIDSTAGGSMFLGMLRNGASGWKDKMSNRVNRERYEHNRRLECRKIVENGSRLRIVRFGFTQPMSPPHTPEMESLGLTKEAYQTILSNIDRIRTNVQARVKSSWSSPMSYLMASLNKIRRRSADDTFREVNNYLREVNTSERRIVWTIEPLPRVYDRGLAGERTEWEISAWNGEDPLELVIQLERWGLIEKKLDVEEED